MHVGRVATVAATLLTMVAGAPAVAQAGTLDAKKPGDSENPVVTHPQPGPVSLPAGAVCAFGVDITFPEADLTRYTWLSGGRPVFAVETGTMLIEVTNAETGASVVRDLSGTGYYLFPDPQTVILTGTRILALLGPGDDPPNQLLFSNGRLMSIRATVVDGAQVKTILLASPTAEDLCQAVG